MPARTSMLHVRVDDPRPAVPHERVMTDAQALIDGKGRARS